MEFRIPDTSRLPFMDDFDNRRSYTNKLLEKEDLPLARVAELVPDEQRMRKGGVDPFAPVPDAWGPYYQSMVRKAASTRDGLFAFDKNGAFASSDPEGACASLCGWLDCQDEADAIRTWLREGTPLPHELFRKLRRKLEAEMLVDTDLYDRPICRLVQVDQLRYDPDYTAVYQLTPAQVRLISEQQPGPRRTARDDEGAEPALERVRKNQRMYWTVSEIFQSSIALFDSDLGRDKPSREGTKNLLHIFDNPEGLGAPVAPHALNQYSPLRFWSPPTAFARFVFHMLFWQPMVTESDLYGRPFSGDTRTRVARYRVAINTFNASKYRIADYSGLLRLIETLTDALQHHGDAAQRLMDLDDLELTHPVFYPNTFVHRQLWEQAKGHVRMPFKSLGERTWELARRYHRSRDATTVGHLFQMLRDRVLEIVLWSRYQMEIRSVGMVPVQRVYRVELAQAGTVFVERLRTLRRRRRWDQLDREFSSAVFSGQLGEWVTLHKEYDREFSRRLFEDSAIQWLKPAAKPNDKPSGKHRGGQV